MSGITAAFNLNILRRLYKEFGAYFDLHDYRLEAVYNDDAGRIEMYLASTEDQSFRIDGREFAIADGERILTEHSHKYTIEGFAGLAAKAGFALQEYWTDANRMFAVCYCSRD